MGENVCDSGRDSEYRRDRGAALSREREYRRDRGVACVREREYRRDRGGSMVEREIRGQER